MATKRTLRVSVRVTFQDDSKIPCDKSYNPKLFQRIRMLSTLKKRVKDILFDVRHARGRHPSSISLGRNSDYPFRDYRYDSGFLFSLERPTPDVNFDNLDRRSEQKPFGNIRVVDFADTKPNQPGVHLPEFRVGKDVARGANGTAHQQDGRRPGQDVSRVFG